MIKQSLGTTIRASRLGYRKVQGVGFVRIRDGGPPHVIDVAPFDHVAIDKVDRHIVWWDDDTLRRMLFEVLFAKFQGAVSVAVTIRVDDDGKIIE